MEWRDDLRRLQRGRGLKTSWSRACQQGEGRHGVGVECLWEPWVEKEMQT
jgi:hypothetical protein